MWRACARLSWGCSASFGVTCASSWWLGSTSAAGVIRWRLYLAFSAAPVVWPCTRAYRTAELSCKDDEYLLMLPADAFEGFQPAEVPAWAPGGGEGVCRALHCNCPAGWQVQCDLLLPHWWHTPSNIRRVALSGVHSYRCKAGSLYPSCSFKLVSGS